MSPPFAKVFSSCSHWFQCLPARAGPGLTEGAQTRASRVSPRSQHVWHVPACFPFFRGRSLYIFRPCLAVTPNCRRGLSSGYRLFFLRDRSRPTIRTRSSWSNPPPPLLLRRFTARFFHSNTSQNAKGHHHTPVQPGGSTNSGRTRRDRKFERWGRAGFSPKDRFRKRKTRRTTRAPQGREPFGCSLHAHTLESHTPGRAVIVGATASQNAGERGERYLYLLTVF